MVWIQELGDAARGEENGMIWHPMRKSMFQSWWPEGYQIIWTPGHRWELLCVRGSRGSLGLFNRFQRATQVAEIHAISNSENLWSGDQ